MTEITKREFHSYVYRFIFDKNTFINNNFYVRNVKERIQKIV